MMHGTITNMSKNMGNQVVIVVEPRSRGRHAKFVAKNVLGVVDADRKLARLVNRLGFTASHDMDVVEKLLMQRKAMEEKAFPPGEGTSWGEIAEAQRIANGIVNKILKSKKSRAAMAERIREAAETQTELIADVLMDTAERMDGGEKIQVVV